MAVYTKPGADVFAPQDNAGNARPVNNGDAQVWATEVERGIANASDQASVIALVNNEATTRASADSALSARIDLVEQGYDANYQNRSQLFADLNHAAGSLGRVFGDATTSYRGVYLKAGGPGSGLWSKIGELAGGGVLGTKDQVTADLLNTFFRYKSSTLLTSASDLNALLDDGLYISTSLPQNSAPGMPAATMVDVRRAGNWILQRQNDLFSPRGGWERIIRPAISQFNQWEPLGGGGSAQLPLTGKTVVLFGDSITEGTGGGNWRTAFAARTGAAVVNGGFGGCRMGVHPLPLYDPMCGYKLSGYIKNGNWADLQTAAQALFDDNADDNRPQANALAGLNWDQQNLICIFMFGTNDFQGGPPTPIGAPTATKDGTTFNGAINKIIDDILTTKPNIQLAFMTPPVMSRDGGPDVKTNANGNKAGDFALAVMERCAAHYLPAFDLFHDGGINMLNEEYWLADEVHPTSAGYAMLGSKIGGWANSAF